MIAVGVDPGLHGAIAVLDAVRCRILETIDIPTVEVRVGKNLRPRLDKASLMIVLRDIKRKYQADPSAPLLATLEDVGPQPKDSRASAFAFGSVCGMIEMALSVSEFRIEKATPGKWKPKMKAPADKKMAHARADAIFPMDCALWRGPQGGRKPDRAEAAMIAKYGADTWLAPPIGREAA